MIRIQRRSAGSEQRCLFFSYEGVELCLPENGLIVDMYPSWSFPEKIAKRPRDERFADIASRAPGSDPRSWWYSNGGFGAIGTVVRTAAEIWGLDVPEVVNRMEACCVTEEGDTRLPLATADGGTFCVDAIRLRRPEAGEG